MSNFHIQGWLRGLLLALVLLSGLRSQVAGQGRAVVAKINPLSVLMLTLNGAVEVGLRDDMSVQGGVFAGGVPRAVRPDGNTMGWLGLTSEWRYYPAREGIQGYYLATYLRYRRVRGENNSAVFDPNVQANRTAQIKERINDFGGGALLGRQWLFDNAFSLELFIGPQFTRAAKQPEITCESCNGNEELIDSSIPVNLGGLGIRAGLVLGLVWDD